MLKLLYRIYHYRLKHRRLNEDTDSSDSSGDSLNMKPRTSTIPEPPRVSDFPSPQGSNAFSIPKVDSDKKSDRK